MDERELIQLYLQQQKPPILDDIIPDVPDDFKSDSSDTVRGVKVIHVQGGRFSINQSEQKSFYK